MSANRVLYVLIVLAVALAAALALDPAMVSKAASQPRGPQSAQRGLTGFAAHADALNDEKQADRAYDQIETERGSQGGPAGLDSSNYIDSATRSYIGWAKAVEERSPASGSAIQAEGLSAGSAKADALNDQPQADRSHDQIETLGGARFLR